MRLRATLLSMSLSIIGCSGATAFDAGQSFDAGGPFFAADAGCPPPMQVNGRCPSVGLECQTFLADAVCRHFVICQADGGWQDPIDGRKECPPIENCRPGGYCNASCRQTIDAGCERVCTCGDAFRQLAKCSDVCESDGGFPDAGG